MEKLIDTVGKLVGFDGLPVAHGREIPRHPGRIEEWPRPDLLPVEARLASFELIELLPSRYSVAVDPFVLYDRWGHILYQWPDNYEPSWVEVMEVCQRFLNTL